ncbi:hypothetical protein CEXT_207431 [Caerostris extrusa]|uniref:Uncharacterized protein n=1 Tax=Caerostris extrusa TaxID=172846 RepID=A0AAV4VQE6_CAEEX|nr:hypothetical protein CEXT_207431 [Caerostris extrusa]
MEEEGVNTCQQMNRFTCSRKSAVQKVQVSPCNDNQQNQHASLSNKTMEKKYEEYPVRVVQAPHGDVKFHQEFKRGILGALNSTLRGMRP